jgi:hypothetical protein
VAHPTARLLAYFVPLTALAHRSISDGDKEISSTTAPAAATTGAPTTAATPATAASPEASLGTLLALTIRGGHRHAHLLESSTAPMLVPWNAPGADARRTIGERTKAKSGTGIGMVDETAPTDFDRRRNREGYSDASRSANS